VRGVADLVVEALDFGECLRSERHVDALRRLGSAVLVANVLGDRERLVVVARDVVFLVVDQERAMGLVHGGEPGEVTRVIEVAFAAANVGQLLFGVLVAFQVVGETLVHALAKLVAGIHRRDVHFDARDDRLFLHALDDHVLGGHAGELQVGYQVLLDVRRCEAVKQRQTAFFAGAVYGHQPCRGCKVEICIQSGHFGRSEHPPLAPHLLERRRTRRDLLRTVFFFIFSFAISKPSIDVEVDE